jgi:hypothetical protein
VASLGSTPGLIVAAGVGAAASAALNPAFEVPKQEAWARNAQRLVGVGTVAELVARGGVILGGSDGSDSGSGYAEARRQGYAASRLDRLVWLAQRMPDYGTLKALANRGLLADGQVPEALNRHAFPADWHKPLTDLFSEILSPGELAAAIHRGLVPNPDILLGEQPSGPRNVASYPVQPIDPVQEALGSGFNKERLAVLVGLQGLPMGTHEAAEAYFRGIITHGDYIAAFNESNSRNEWAEAVLDYTRQIPTARDFFENALRGYHDLGWAQQQAQRHGMDEADSLVIYQNQGRPMAVRQITQALARGGRFKPEPGEITDPFEASIVEGNLKPGYYDLAKAMRYTYSVPFWWRTLVSAKVLTPAEAEQLLLNLGNPPDLAKKITDHFAGDAGATAKADPAVASEQTRLRTATHKSYLAGEITKTIARNTLGAAGVAAGSITSILGLWDAERALIRQQLTPANIKRAFNKGGKNNATGKAWTRDEALAALIDLGYAPLAANDYLDIP